MNEDFIKIIDEDIQKCENELKKGNKESKYVLHGTLLSKYGKIIDGFEDNLHSLFYDSDGAYVARNIETMRQKLLLFKAMDYENRYAARNSGDITFNNSNHIETTINISFTEAKKQIENMSSLREDEIEEITSKIDEIERIVNSKDRKTKKWEEAKEIIKWIAEKGVDVGITLLPLLLQIGN
ncbi:MAG: hypothetical protein IJN12_01010 [Clostridia bacterium]|nr:hypothetical protein [Clostridia bacterium]